MKKLVVNKKYDNKKLDKFLKDNISTLSNNLFYKTLRKKDIKIMVKSFWKCYCFWKWWNSSLYSRLFIRK